MATLTFRERIMDGQKVLKRFQRLLAARGMGSLPFCWVREYQGRGAVHYHCLWGAEALTAAGYLDPRWTSETVKRGKALRRMVRGPLERKIVEAWSAAVGDESEEFRRFQWGGIVELMDKPTSAAAYFGSYLSKPEQKTLPRDAEVHGRWWYMSPTARPVPTGRGFATRYPYEGQLSVIFDKETVGAIQVCEPVTETMPTMKEYLL